MTVTIPIFVRFTDAGLSISAPEWVWWVVGATAILWIAAKILLFILRANVKMNIHHDSFSQTENMAKIENATLRTAVATARIASILEKRD